VINSWKVDERRERRNQGRSAMVGKRSGSFDEKITGSFMLSCSTFTYQGSGMGKSAPVLYTTLCKYDDVVV
jgi:hypothetical protein